MVTEVEKSPNLKLVVDRAFNLHLQLQNHLDSPLFQLIDLPMEAAKNAIENVYRAVVIAAFRQAIHETFLDNEEILSTEDLRQGAAILIECQNLVEGGEEEFELVCIAEKFDLIRTTAIYAATEPTLRQRFTDEIRALLNDTEPYEFDGTSVNSLRLSFIYQTLVENVASLSNLELLINLIHDNNFHEIEEPFRQTWLDEKFEDVQDTLQGNGDISTLLVVYQEAIQKAFGVTFNKFGANASDWNVVSLHYARLGLEATAEALERWIEANPPYNPVDPNASNLNLIINRFHIFRRVMGNMQFTNVEEARTNFALSQGRQIQIYKRPKEILYWVYEEDGVTKYAPQVLANGNAGTQPPAYSAVEAHFQYTDDTYPPSGNGSLVPDRQAILTPNNLIHELGHSFDNFAGFSFARLASLRYTAAHGTPEHPQIMPQNRASMGPSYLRPEDLFYEHAHITDNNSDAVAEFTGFAEPTTFDKTGYLQYDIFGDVYALWNSAYNIYKPINMNARIDTFVHNPEESDDWTEPVADAFLSWVRDAFLSNETEGQKWIDFFNNHMGTFMRNSAVNNIGMAQFYQEFIHSPSTERPLTASTAQLRLVPNLEASTVVGKAYDPSDDDNNRDLEATRLYGWADNEGYRWFLVEYRNVLLWIIIDPFGTATDQDTAPEREIQNPLGFSPDLPLSETDLRKIIGEGVVL